MQVIAARIQLYGFRQKTMYLELVEAISNTPPDVLHAWGKESAATLPCIMARRMKNFGGILKSIVKSAHKESQEFRNAKRNNQIGAHLADRLQAAVDESREFKNNITKTISDIQMALSSTPKELAPQLAVQVLAFMVASGGVDGDGGVPDLDLLFGIEAHRSILTHSILSGAIIETLLLSTATLIDVLHKYLPEMHDPLWDTIAKHKNDYISVASRGASLGIAYHLFIDSVFEPASYHDLPGHHSMEFHRGIMGTNAVIEANDTVRK